MWWLSLAAEMAEHPTASFVANAAPTDTFCICVSVWEFHVLNFPGLTYKEKAHLRLRSYFVQQFYTPSCQDGREDSLQTVGKKTFISSGPGLQRCCLCYSPGYNSECTQHQWHPKHSFMRQRRANPWDTDHMQRRAWVCVWMQTNTK